MLSLKITALVALAAGLLPAVLAQAPSLRALPEIEQCIYACPSWDQKGHALSKQEASTTVDTTFTCVYENAETVEQNGTCVYQISTGVMYRDHNSGECNSAAMSLVYGCSPGQTHSNGRRRRNVVRSKPKPKQKRSSREIQQARFARKDTF